MLTDAHRQLITRMRGIPTGRVLESKQTPDSRGTYFIYRDCTDENNWILAYIPQNGSLLPHRIEQGSIEAVSAAALERAKAWILAWR